MSHVRLLCLALLLACAVCPAPGAPAIPIPFPDLVTLDPAVQRQLHTARTEFEAAIAKPDATDAELTRAYGALGQLYHGYEFLDAAQACYQNAVALAPLDGVWRYSLAVVSQIKGDAASAIASLQAALALDPKNVPALLRLAEIRLDRGELPEASALFEKVLAIDSKSAAALAGLGKVALAGKDFRRAVERFEMALAVDPQASALYYPLGMAYRGLGDNEKARDLLSRRGAGKPSVPDPILDAVRERMTGKQALWSRGFTAFRSGQYAKAAEAYRQMTEVDPNEPVAWMELGSALLKMGDSRAALENYRRALQLAPGNALVHQNLAICLTQMGSAREAVEHYRAAIRADPGMRQSYFHLANELMRLGIHQEAAELYAKAVAQEPGNEFARFMEAIALVRLGRYKEARTRLESAITALPGDADLAYALARVLAAAPEASIRDGRLALQTVQKLFAPGSSPDVEYVQTLAMALAENGRYAEALRIQDTLIERARQAGRSDLLSVLEANRKQYQAGKPCRIPWPPNDPIFSPVPGPATPLTSGAPPASMR